MIPEKKVYGTFPMVLNRGDKPAAQVDVFVCVDLAAIAWDLAARAFRNKSRSCRYKSGAVVVEVRNVQILGGEVKQ